MRGMDEDDCTCDPCEDCTCDTTGTITNKYGEKFNREGGYTGLDPIWIDDQQEFSSYTTTINLVTVVLFKGNYKMNCLKNSN